MCNKKVETQRLPALLTMDKVCRSLARLTSTKYALIHTYLCTCISWMWCLLCICFLCSNFSPIMVPIQSSLTVTLPMSKGSHQDHNPFPGELPYIIKFNEKVKLFMTTYIELTSSWSRWKFWHLCRNQRRSVFLLVMASHIQCYANQTYIIMISLTI